MTNSDQKLEGGCYCGAVRYVAAGAPILKGQCHCRECQYLSGGSANLFLMMPLDGFAYERGSPKRFTRNDIEQAVTREFCSECGTHLTTRRPGMPGVILKVGTLDDPSLFGAPQMAIYAIDKQAFHQIPDGLPTFERLPRLWLRAFESTRRRYLIVAGSSVGHPNSILATSASRCVTRLCFNPSGCG